MPPVPVLLDAAVVAAAGEEEGSISDIAPANQSPLSAEEGPPNSLAMARLRAGQARSVREMRRSILSESVEGRGGGGGGGRGAWEDGPVAPRVAD